MIYLLAIGMLMPTWLLTGMMSAQHVKTATSMLVGGLFEDGDTTADFGLSVNSR